MTRRFAPPGCAGTGQEMGFMYARDFEDPDGNLFSVFWMDPVAAEQGPGAAEQAPPEAP